MHLQLDAIAASHDLLNEGIVAGRLTLKLTYVENSDIGPSTSLAATNAIAKEALVSIQQMGSGTRLSAAGGVIDSGAPLTTVGQQAFEDAETLSPYFGPLGEALSSLGRIVAIVDGVAEVSRNSCAMLLECCAIILLDPPTL
jgi:hypothetical protein